MDVSTRSNRLLFWKGPTETRSRSILKGLSGSAEPGELLAIMGASGSGKTTLLNILAQRQTSSARKGIIVGGQITINGAAITPSSLKSAAAYIMQDDVLMETLSPREILNFSAALRLPNDTTAGERRGAVERTIASLNLESCADTRVGGIFLRGISGGERKRVCIAQELITDPHVLFVDEPTSGLDSSTAEKVVILLKRLASQGRTVITTIHQPSSDIFAIFDKLILLAAGKTVYFGAPSDAVPYFAKIGYECPQYSNPGDYFMKIMQGDGGKGQEGVDELIKAYEDERKLNEFDQIVPPAAQVPFQKSDQLPCTRELGLLTARAFRNFIRQPMMTRVRFLQNVFTGLLVGVIFYQLSNTQTSIQDRQGALFMVVMNNAMSSIMTTVLSFPPEKAIFLRERANKTYSVGAYYWGKTLSEFPFQFIFPIVNASIAYWMVGLQPALDRFVIFLLTAILLALAGQSYGIMIGCIVTDATAAVAITPVTVIPLMLFAGFFVNPDSIPAWIAWIQYLSPFKYGFEALAINEFTDLTLICTPDELIGISGHDGAPSICPITSGAQVLQRLSITNTTAYPSLMYLFIIFIIVRFAGFLALRFRQDSVY